MDKGNTFAYLIVTIWPLITVWLYKTKSIQTASALTILVGFLLLPVQTVIDLPMIPAMGKHTIPVVSALICCWLIKKQPVLYFNELGKIKYLVVLLISVPFITASLNSDPLVIGGRYIKGETYYDGVSSSILQFLTITPFFIGRQFFKTYEHQLLMFRLLVIAGLLYSIPMLYEIRMSPQLHSWFYGYFPHEFSQQKRVGGFRPVVFLGHGLWVAFFTAVGLITSVALWNNNVKIGLFKSKVTSFYMLAILVLCKSIASLMYGVFAFVLLKLVTVKIQHKVAIALVCLALLYPFMSILNVFPHKAILDVAALMSEDRAASLDFRFNNEEILLDKAKERIYFGWGGWGRNRVFDNETGKDLSVTDGGWIITFGQFGIFGFIAEFGLLAAAIFRAYTASKLIESKSELSLLAAHAILIGIVMLDQLPNASLKPWLWLLAGALLGRAEEIVKRYKAAGKLKT